MKYRKKPVVIEAVQYFGNNSQFVMQELGMTHPRDVRFTETGGMLIQTLEGEHIAAVNDYIIKGVKGEFYPCKPDIFEMIYEAANAIQSHSGGEAVGEVRCRNGEVYGYIPKKVIRDMLPLGTKLFIMPQDQSARIAELEAENKAYKADNNLLTHKVLTCGVAASHPDINLSKRQADYGGKWDSPSAQDVRKLRSSHAELQEQVKVMRNLVQHLRPKFGDIGTRDIDVAETQRLFDDAMKAGE